MMMMRAFTSGNSSAAASSQKRRVQWVSADEEEIIWGAYSKEERRRTGEQDDSSETSQPASFYYRTFCAVFCWRSHKIDWSFTWIGELALYYWQILDSSEGPKERLCRYDFLNRTIHLAVPFLIINSVVLCGINYLPLCGLSGGNRQTSRSAFIAWAFYNSSWLLFSLLALGFYAVLILDRRDHLFRLLHTSALDMLDLLGKCIFIGRVLLLLQMVSIFTSSSDTCTELNLLHPQDSTFSIIFGRMVMDLLQVSLISLLPVKRPYIYSLGVIESAAQLTRLFTCRDRLHLDASFDHFLMSLGLIIVLTYMVISASPAFTLEQSCAASLEHLQRLHETSQEKKHLVNMLCSDLKVPLQQIKQLWRDQTLSPFLAKKSLKHVEKNLMAVTMIVDNVLFLLRVQEKRFQFYCSDELWLPGVVQEIIGCCLVCNDLSERCYGERKRERRDGKGRPEEHRRVDQVRTKGHQARLQKTKNKIRRSCYGQTCAFLSPFSPSSLISATRGMKGRREAVRASNTGPSELTDEEKTRAVIAAQGSQPNIPQEKVDDGENYRDVDDVDDDDGVEDDPTFLTYQVPYERVQSNKNCFRVMLYYAVSAAIIRCQYSQSLQAQHLSDSTACKAEDWRRHLAVTISLQQRSPQSSSSSTSRREQVPPSSKAQNAGKGRIFPTSQAFTATATAGADSEGHDSRSGVPPECMIICRIQRRDALVQKKSKKKPHQTAPPEHFPTQFDAATRPENYEGGAGRAKRKRAKGKGLDHSCHPRSSTKTSSSSSIRRLQGFLDQALSWKATLADSPEQSLAQYQSNLLFCEHIARACGGNFCHVPETGTIIFSLPGRFLPSRSAGGPFSPASSLSGPSSLQHTSELRNNSSVHIVTTQESLPSSSVPSSSASSFSYLSPPSQSSDLPLLSPTIAQELCIYSTDPILLPFVLHAFHAILPPSLHHTLPILEHLNMADLHVHSVVVVTSLHDCVELESKGYTGLVVLMSDRLSYLDDRDWDAEKCSRWALPCTHGQLREMADWLRRRFPEPVGKRLEGDAWRQTVISPRTLLGVLPSGHLMERDDHDQNPEGEEEEGRRWEEEGGRSRPMRSRGGKSHLFPSFSSWSPISFSCLFSRVSSSLRSMFNKVVYGLFPPMPFAEAPTHLLWRLINPSLQAYHHTTILDAEIAACLICQIIIYAQFGPKRASSLIGLSPFLVIVILRAINPAWLAHRRIALYRVFAFLNFVILFVVGFSSYSLFFSFSQGVMKSYDTESMTWLQFLKEDFSGRLSTGLDGQRLILLSLQAIYASKCTADILMWPYSLLASINAGLFSHLTFYLIIYPFFTNYERVFLSCTLSMYQVLMLGVLVYTEYLKRTEYLHLREAILARDLCERCLSRCWYDCSQPLVFLITWQARLRRNVLSVWARNVTRGRNSNATPAGEAQATNGDRREGRGSGNGRGRQPVRSSGGTAANAHQILLHRRPLPPRHPQRSSLPSRPALGHSSSPRGQTLSSSHLLSSSLLADMAHPLEQLKRSICMSTELLHEMQMSLVSSRPRDLNNLITSMEVYLLRPIVHKICSMFVLETEDLTIQFNLCIHPSLLLVRCDKALLEAMLCSTCRNAVERIQHSIKESKQQQQQQQQQQEQLAQPPQASPGSLSFGEKSAYKHPDGIRHSVLISLKPAPYQEKLRFSDVRMMLLQVFDTSLQLSTGGSFPSTFLPSPVQHDEAPHLFDRQTAFSPTPLSFSSPPSGSTCYPLSQPCLRHTFLKNIYRSYMIHHHQPDVLYALHHFHPTQADWYSTCEYLNIPYKMCPATPKVAAFFPLRSALTETLEKSHMLYLRQYQRDITVEDSSKTVDGEGIGEEDEEAYGEEGEESADSKVKMQREAKAVEGKEMDEEGGLREDRQEEKVERVQTTDGQTHTSAPMPSLHPTSSSFSSTNTASLPYSTSWSSCSSSSSARPYRLPLEEKDRDRDRRPECQEDKAGSQLPAASTYSSSSFLPHSSSPSLSQLPLPHPTPSYTAIPLVILCPHWQQRYGGPPSLLSLRDYAACGWMRKLHYLQGGELPRREMLSGESSVAMVIIEQEVIRAAAREVWQQRQYLQDLLLYIRVLGCVGLVVRVGGVTEGEEMSGGSRRSRESRRKEGTKALSSPSLATSPTADNSPSTSASTALRPSSAHPADLSPLPPTSEIGGASTSTHPKAIRPKTKNKKRAYLSRSDLDDLPWTRSLSEGLAPDFDVAGPLDKTTLLRLRHQWHLRLLHLSIPSAT